MNGIFLALLMLLTTPAFADDLVKIDDENFVETIQVEKKTNYRELKRELLHQETRRNICDQEITKLKAQLKKQENLGAKLIERGNL